MTRRRKILPVLPCSEKGMTLLEIMLAILMLAMVMTMVSISISGSFDVIDATEKQGEIYYRAQVALQRMSEDLTSVLLVEGVEFNGNSKDNDSARGNILEFTSTAHIVFDPENDHPGIALISYTLSPDKNNENEFVLLRSDTLLGTFDAGDLAGEERERFLLCDRLRSVRFSYFNETGEEHENWSSLTEDANNREERKLPVSVDVTLEFWLDHEAGTWGEFTTRVLLPVGLLDFEITPEGSSV